MRGFCLTAVILLVSLQLHSLAFASNSSKCKLQQEIFTNASKNGHPIDFYYFKNDTKETIQLTWAGDAIGVIILVTMSESEQGLGQPSDIYRSIDNGKTFEKITKNLGENIFIKRENGLQTRKIHNFMRKIYVICHNVQNRNHSVIYSTTDSGQVWKKSDLPFILNGKLKFSPQDQDSDLVLTLEAISRNLYVSNDGGITWNHALQEVQECFWSSFTVDSKNSLYAVHGKAARKSNTNRSSFTLSKSEDGGQSWRVIMENVRKIWAPEVLKSDSELEESGSKEVSQSSRRFLYVAHFVDAEKSVLQLSVSDDGGATFRRVHLPTVVSDRFFSVLEIEKNCVFLHVDEPGDTGHGILYVSDSTGTVFTESLRRHFYPNHAAVTDFFRILSIPGTFLATQMNPDTTLRTVITHDRGATWHPLPVPEGLSCGPSGSSKMVNEPTGSAAFPSADYAADGQPSGGSTSKNTTNETYEPVCGLQVSNQFSLRKRVVASPPLATSTARGLILVHGHVATHLKTTPADVFISTDGGYSWHKGLDGPHHYQIANRGGLLVAVPADTLWVDILLFSTDGGRCWHNISLIPSMRHETQRKDDGDSSQSSTAEPEKKYFTISPEAVTHQSPSASASHPMDEEAVVFTGLVTEPGGRAMTVAVYGYGTLSQRWRVAVVDFAHNGFITKNCTAEDYELWFPHRTDANRDKSDNGCLLGVRETSYRLKENSLCFSGGDFQPVPTQDICECTELDYECEYGYWRELGSGGKCVVNPHAPPLDICDLVGQEAAPHLFELVAYRRIPGDRCIGGWEPPQSNISFEQRTKHCHLKRQSFGLATKVTVTLVTLALLLICVAILWLRRRGASGGPPCVPEGLRRCLQRFHLLPGSDFKSNPLVPNTVFFASGELGNTGKPSSTPSQYLAPQITRIGGCRRSEDQMDLLENEALFLEEENYPAHSTNNRDEQRESDDYDAD